MRLGCRVYIYINLYMRPPPLPPNGMSMVHVHDIEYDEPTPPPVVLCSEFGGFIERLSLYKLIVFVKGLSAVTQLHPPPPH